MIKGLRFPTSGNNPAAAANTPASTRGANAEEEELAPGWKMVTSRTNGKSYYLHTSTGATQWDKPINEEGKAKNVADKISSGASRFGAGLTSGLTSMWSTANTKLQNSLNTSTARPASSKNQPIVDRQGQEVHETFENERIDGELTTTDPKKYSDKSAKAGSGSEDWPELELPEGYEWTSEWEIDYSYTSVDKDGWTYGLSFQEINKHVTQDCSHASKHPNDLVRRRRWVRYMKNPELAEQPVVAEVTEAAEDSEPVAIPAMTVPADSVDDPFSKAQKANQGTGFRVPNMKFPRRGDKDHTKDYQNLGVADIEWLVKIEPKDSTKSAEALRAETANLTERIKDASQRASEVDKSLNHEHDKYAKRIESYDGQLGSTISQYKQLNQSYLKLQAEVTNLRASVDVLKQETTKLDIAQNEEQRMLNDEMESTNQAMEEKAKALATVRLRYKQDMKTLQARFQEASTRKDQIAVDTSENPLRSELKKYMDKLTEVNAKLESTRQQRHAVDKERREMFNQVVEHRADMKLNTKNKLEQSLVVVEKQIAKLKDEQKLLIKTYTENADPTLRAKIDDRRNDVRKQLSALRERRMKLRKDQT